MLAILKNVGLGFDLMTRFFKTLKHLKSSPMYDNPELSPLNKFMIELKTLCKDLSKEVSKPIWLHLSKTSRREKLFCLNSIEDTLSLYK